MRAKGDAGAIVPSLRNRRSTLRRLFNARYLFLMLLIPVIYVFIFNYVPIYGVSIAFKRYSPRMGIQGSQWVGLENFQRFFSSPAFWKVLRNTLNLSVYSLIASFPFPILLAIAINHCLLPRFKKAVQMVTFAPYFLSSVLLVGLITQMFSLRGGIVNHGLDALGMQRVNFMGEVNLFNDIYVWSGVWQTTGYSAILYISALAGVDPTYHEAARIDGASLWQRVWHIDLPTIRPTIIIMLILSMGSILGVGFEKAYLMQNPMNLEASEVISTYLYKVSIANTRPDYSFGTAIGLFQNVVGIILTLSVNKVADKLTGEGMF